MQDKPTAELVTCLAADGQPLKAGRKKRELRIVEVWHDDREAQAEAILYLASLTEEYATSGSPPPQSAGRR